MTRRRVVWLQVLIGWIPIWALFAVQIHLMHGGHTGVAVFAAFRMMLAAALLGLVVNRIIERLPWPLTVTPGFVLTHLGLSFLFSHTWFLLNSVIESMVRRQLVLIIPVGYLPFILVGVWLYVMIAGVSYSAQATERAANAEAAAVKAQLAALRSQLNPHFLFNALHTVVQLIPRDPKRASTAAEELADLLRSTVDADHDVVPLSTELAFVEKYLSIEHLRFGDRLRVRMEVSDDARRAAVPSFSVQTLVENAVRHGAAPRVEPTDISIAAGVSGNTLTITVSDTGVGSNGASPGGTGLRRLRERLAALYAGAATLSAGPAASGGYSATLTLPKDAGD